MAPGPQGARASSTTEGSRTFQHDLWADSTALGHRVGAAGGRRCWVNRWGGPALAADLRLRRRGRGLAPIRQ